MSIIEIDNFRKKYPEYNDMSDSDLANSLAKKYPEYSDLPGKVSSISSTQSQPQKKGGMPSVFPGSALFSKEAWQPLSKTIGGKSLTQMSQDSPIPTKMTGNKMMDAFRSAQMGIHGFQRDVVASAADIATTPGNYVLGPALGAAEGMIGKAGSFVVGGIKKAFTAGKDLKNVETELSQQPLTKLNLSNEIRNVRNVSKEQIPKMEKSFTDKIDTLKSELKKHSQIVSGQNKTKLQGLFKNISSTYRKGLDQAENVLIKKGTIIKPQEYIDDVIEKTFNELRSKGFPEDSPAFNEISKVKDNLSNLYKSTELKLSDLRNLKNQVYDSLSSSVKSGNKYADANDQVANIFLKNHGEYIGKLSPELSQLNKEFAPMANARAWASKTFKPYNDFEIQRGANVLERIAKSDVPNKTDLNYIKQLEEGSGRFKGSGSLKGNVEKIGKDIKLTKESFDTAKKKLIDSADYKINQLQDRIARLQERGIKLGFEREKLKKLITTRNIIIGITLTSVAAPKAIKEGSKLIIH